MREWSAPHSGAAPDLIRGLFISNEVPARRPEQRGSLAVGSPNHRRHSRENGNPGELAPENWWLCSLRAAGAITTSPNPLIHIDSRLRGNDGESAAAPERCLFAPSPFDGLGVRAWGSILPGRPGLRAGACSHLAWRSRIGSGTARYWCKRSPRQPRQAFASRVCDRAGVGRGTSHPKLVKARRTASHSSGVLGLDCVNGLGSIPALFREYTAAVTAAGSGAVLASAGATSIGPGPFPSEGSYASSLRAGR